MARIITNASGEVIIPANELETLREIISLTSEKIDEF